MMGLKQPFGAKTRQNQDFKLHFYHPFAAGVSGHTVAVLVRSAARLDQLLSSLDAVTVIEGDALVGADVSKVLDGAEAVLFALGMNGSSPPKSVHLPPFVPALHPNDIHFLPNFCPLSTHVPPTFYTRSAHFLPNFLPAFSHLLPKCRCSLGNSAQLITATCPPGNRNFWGVTAEG
jgi:hypothetical protein